MDTDSTPKALNGTNATSKAAARYGIAEWYGKNIAIMTPAERRFAALVAQGNSTDVPICPFMSTLTPGAKCNKKGGVCTIRKYDDGETGFINHVAGGTVATTCPARFLGVTANNESVLSWVSKKMLDSERSTIVKETPFLRTLLSSYAIQQRPTLSQQLGFETLEDATIPYGNLALDEEGKKAGRIDWLLIDPATENDTDPKWCALETQAVYFSGDKMGPEFDAYANNPDSVLFPVGFRRPDYRSSGPKRLAPQLSVKVPVLRGWGKKVAVLVDKYFFDSMCDLPEAFIHGRSDKEKRDNCEVAWFVVDYDSEMFLTLESYRFSTLNGSVEALNATAPMSKETFNNNLRKLTVDKKKAGKKVFRT